jgi:type VI secretion system FHA domain protein
MSMQLSMTVLRCPDQVAPEARTVSGGEFHVGRGPDVDWVLPDPDRLLSKRHFAVAFRGGAWQVADTSTNGTFLNTEPDALGRGAARTLRDGDRLRLGAYEIEMRLVDQPAQSGYAQGGYSPAGGFGGGGHAGQSPFGDPFGEDPMAPAPAARRPFDEPAYPDLGMAPTSARLPHDFDPLAPDHDEPFGGGFRGPVQADNRSSMEDAMIPPPIAGYTAPQTGGIIPGDDLLPDDWDKDLLEGIAPPGASPVAPPPVQAPAQRPVPVQAAPPPAAHPLPATPLEEIDFLDDPLAPVTPAPEPAAHPATHAAPPSAPWESEPAPPTAFAEPAAPIGGAPSGGIPSGGAPVVRQRTPKPAAAPPPTTGLDANPFNEPDQRPAAPPPFAAEAPLSAASPFDEPSDRPEPVAVAAPAPAQPVRVAPPAQTPTQAAPAPTSAVPAMDDSGALAAFFKGAELSGAHPTDPMAMMTGLGQAFRALVSGLRAVLIARATIKGEFRIEQTMIRARGNNPLKFSANDDDALTALLGVGRRTDMAPAAAIEDSLRDLRLHELATMAAMQVAVRAMLDELSPDKIRAGSDQGGITVLPAQRKARAWDAFEAKHAAVVQALMDDFDSIFGKSFARAYERALDEISQRERQ